MPNREIIRYLNKHPQDFSLSPRMNLFIWAREEIARQMGHIDKSITEPPSLYLDGRDISRQDVIDMLNMVQAKLSQFDGGK